MRIYLDTSVLSARFDARNPERLEITKDFFAGRSADRIVVSELTLAEIAARQNLVRTAMSKLADRCETVLVTPDADRLATRYIDFGAVSEAFSADAFHIAIAVICGADVIVS